MLDIRGFNSVLWHSFLALRLSTLTQMCKPDEDMFVEKKKKKDLQKEHVANFKHVHCTVCQEQICTSFAFRINIVS